MCNKRKQNQMTVKNISNILYVYVLDLLFYIVFFAAYRITDQDTGSCAETYIYTHTIPHGKILHNLLYKRCSNSNWYWYIKKKKKKKWNCEYGLGLVHKKLPDLISHSQLDIKASLRNVIGRQPSIFLNSCYCLV